MQDARDNLNEADIRSFCGTLEFAREYAISVFSYSLGEGAIELSFDERFSGPQNLFPAPIVGSAEDGRWGFVLPIPLAEGIGSDDAGLQGQDDWRRTRKVNIFV